MTDAPAASALADGVFHLANAVGVKASQRFVKQYGTGVVQVSGADRHLLPHAAAQFLGQCVSFGGEFKLVEKAFGFGFVIGHLVSGGRKPHVFPHSESIKKLGVVWHICQLLFGGDGVGHYIMPRDQQLAARGRDDSRDRPHGGGFARAVWAQKAQHLTRLHVER